MVRDLGGFIPCTTGQNVRITSLLADPTARIAAQTIRLAPHPDNAAIVYYGLAGMNITSGVGVLGVLADPASTTTGSFTPEEIIQRDSSNGLNVADIYIQGATGAKVIASYVQG